MMDWCLSYISDYTMGEWGFSQQPDWKSVCVIVYSWDLTINQADDSLTG